MTTFTTRTCKHTRAITYEKLQLTSDRTEILDELTLAEVNKTATRVASLGDATHRMDTTRTAAEAVSLIAH